MAREPSNPAVDADPDGENRVIDLNTADEDTLARFQNVGHARARILIAHRPYKDWEEVSRLPDIGPEIVDILSLGGVQIGHPTPAG
jgi:DNA uptake protein ComE-like DNA-binding protein